MTRIRATALTLLVLALTSCASPAVHPPDEPELRDPPPTAAADREPDAPEPDQEAGPVMPGEVWYTTYDAEDPDWIHRLPDGKRLMPGDAFAVSDDGRLVAVRSDGVLKVVDAAGNHIATVASAVERFMWRPGTHQLLYLVRDSENGYYANWRRWQPDGTDELVTSAPFISAVWASPDPDGQRLAYIHGREIEIISLADLSQSTIPLRWEEDSSQLQWAGRDQLSVLDLSGRLVLVDAAGGARTHVRKDAEPVHSFMWSADGSAVAMGLDDRVQVFRNDSLVVECKGAWSPLSWSPDGRYLLLQAGKRLQDFELYLLDTAAGPSGDCSPANLSGAVYVEAWHPESKAVILRSAPRNRTAADLQLWVIDDGKPALVQEFGPGSHARWVKPGLLDQAALSPRSATLSFEPVPPGTNLPQAVSDWLAVARGHHLAVPVPAEDGLYLILSAGEEGAVQVSRLELAEDRFIQVRYRVAPAVTTPPEPTLLFIEGLSFAEKTPVPVLHPEHGAPRLDPVANHHGLPAPSRWLSAGIILVRPTPDVPVRDQVLVRGFALTWGGTLAFTVRDDTGQVVGELVTEGGGAHVAWGSFEAVVPITYRPLAHTGRLEAIRVSLANDVRHTITDYVPIRFETERVGSPLTAADLVMGGVQLGTVLPKTDALNAKGVAITYQDAWQTISRDRQVWSITLLDGQTGRGLRPGDERSRVEELYGPPHQVPEPNRLVYYSSDLEARVIVELTDDDAVGRVVLERSPSQWRQDRVRLHDQLP